MYEYKPYAKTGNYLNSQTCFTNTFLKLQTVKKMCVLYAHPPVQLGLKPDFQKTILLHIDDSFSDPEQCLSGSQLCYNGTSIVLSDKNNLMSYKVLLITV